MRLRPHIDVGYDMSFRLARAVHISYVDIKCDQRRDLEGMCLRSLPINQSVSADETSVIIHSFSILVPA